ncbi:MAG TPA: MBL fold metallo-hydrolase [Terriglobales bacterium]|nr:MBL fold metallo-hydrolase [Terriglobales bacterium]
MDVELTYVGGPTAVIHLDGLCFLTDPTFDLAPTNYPYPAGVLHKTLGPAQPPESLGHVDAVLLSHDHHPDNLDNAGREFLKQSRIVITTPAGAERLRGNAIGLAPWQAMDVRSADDRVVRVTATPARHGPAHLDRGPVIGFVLTPISQPENSIYFSGDTVWYEGVEEVASRFHIRTALLNLGAAKVEAVGPWHLTMTAEEAVTFAHAFPDATIVPLHFEGWEHFTEGQKDIEDAFAGAGLSSRLRWLVALGVIAGARLLTDTF